MLDALGDGYIAEFIICELNKEKEEQRYMLYISQGIYAISNNYKLKEEFTFKPLGADKEPPNEKKIRERILKKLRE